MCVLVLFVSATFIVKVWECRSDLDDVGEEGQLRLVRTSPLLCVRGDPCQPPGVWEPQPQHPIPLGLVGFFGTCIPGRRYLE